MKTRLFPFFKSSVRTSSVLAASITMMLGAHSASAATLYWDTDGTTSGFGTASGTWDTDAFWSTDATGASATAATVTTTADFINFGTGTVGLAAGPIAVAGTVSAGSITFGSASGAIALTGGTITLATGAIITVDNASDSISSILAGTNWTKAGTGTLILSGANTHNGLNTLSAGTLVMANPQALGTNIASNAISFTGTTAILDIATDGGDLAYKVSAGSGTISTIASNVKTGSVGINHTLGTLGIGGSATAGLTRLNIVAGGAVLSGTPSITLGAVTLSSGAASVISTFNPTTASLTVGSVTTSGASTGTKVLNLDGTSTGNFVTGAIINGTSSVAVTKTNTSTWTLSGVNTYTGGTTIAGGLIKMSGATSTIGSINNTLTINAGALDLNGTNQGVGILTGSITAGSNAIYNSGSSTTSTLTLGNNNATGGIFAGTIANTNGVGTGIVALTKTGTGTQTLSGTNTYTGATTLSAGTLSVAASANLGAAASNLVFDGGTLQITGTALTSLSGIGHAVSFNATKTVGLDINTASHTFTANQVLNQTTGGLTKLGAGTLTLTSANTYTGATTLSAGTLAVSSTGSLANSAITVSNAGSTFKVSPGAGTVALGNTATTLAGATLNLGSGTVFSMVDGNIGITNLVQGATFPTAGLTLSTAALNFELSGATADVLNVTKFATLAGTNTINLTPLAALTNGTYNLITAASGMAGTFKFANGQTTSVGTFGANNYLLTLSSSATAASVNVSSPGILSWTGQTAGNGAANTSWDTAGSTNWANGTTATAYADGNIVIFNDANGVAGGTTPTGAVVIQAAGVTPGSATFNNSTVNYTVSNASGTTGLAGAGTLTKSGTATLTLSGVNTYTGGTAITAGTIKLGIANALGANGASVAVNSGALLDLNGTNQAINFTAGTGAGTVANNFGSGTSILTLAGTAVTIVDNTNSTSGKVAVVVTTNSQAMSNSNTYSGGTTVNGGAFLYLNAPNPLGAGTGGINLTTALTSGLVSDPGVSIANDISGPGYVSINQQANGTLTLTGNLTNTGNYTFRNTSNVQAYNFAGNGTTSTLSGVIGGTGGTNGGTITGSITKSGTGILTLSGQNVYTGTTTISAGTLKLGATGTATYTPLGTTAAGTTVSGTGTLDLAGFTLGAAEALSLAGTGTASSGALANSGGAATYSGLVTLGAAASIVSNGNIVLSNVGTITGATIGLTLDGTATGSSIASIIGTTTGTLTKQGNGTWTLSGANTYTGTTTIAAGILRYGVSNAISTGAVTLTGGTLDMVGFTDSVAAFTLTSGTLKMAANQTGTAQLVSTGVAALGTTNTLDLTGMGTTAGLYKLVSGTSLTGTFGTVTGLDSAYTLKYGTVNANQLDAQRKADQAAFTVTTPAGTPRALVSTNVALSGTLTNTAPSGSAALAAALTSTGTLTINSLTSSTGATVAVGTPSTISGSIATGASTGTFGWQVTNTDANAVTTTKTISGNINVVNQRSFSVGTSPIALGRFLISATPAGTTAITSLGLNNVTANASLGSFSGVSGLTLTTGDPTTFNGGAASQTANYTVGGTANSAGAISGTFSSTVTAELGSIAPVTVNVSGSALNQRSFSVGTTPIALGTIHAGAASTGAASDTAITSLGLNAVTANASLGGFSGTNTNGLTLTTGDATAFNGATSSQTANYVIAGSVAAGVLSSASFSSSVTAELGSISNVVVSVTGSVFNGNSVWTGIGSSWGTGASSNWVDSNSINAAPGTFAGFGGVDSATFNNSGIATLAVNLNGSTPSLNALTFNSTSSYTLAQGTSGSLTLAGTTPSINVTGTHTISAPVALAANTTATVNSSSSLSVSGVISGSGFGLTKSGSGTLELAATNTYTGTTDVNAGTLLINGALAGGAVNVALPATLGGSGTIGGATTISGTHAAGNNGVGTQTFSSTLNYGTGSIFEWDFNATPGVTGIAADAATGLYDQVAATGAITGGAAIFKMVLSGNTFADAFWETDKSWSNIFSGAGTPTNLAAVFSSFSPTGGLDSSGAVSGRGQFTFNGSTSTLNWSAVPEPTSALAGLLLGAGLLRRRRVA